MTKPKKKPKTGDFVRWVLIDRDGDPAGAYSARKDAREWREYLNTHGEYRPYAIYKAIKQ